MNPPTFTPEQREIIRVRIAAGDHSAKIAEMMGCTRKTILNIALRHKLGPWVVKNPGAARFPIPEDFLTFAPGKTQSRIAAHYGISRTLAGRLQQRAGIAPNPTTKARPATKRPATKPQAAKPARFVRNYAAGPVDRPQRDMSPAGLAQEILQRDRWTVFRCNAEGRADVAGRFWLCGRVICSDQELIERAGRAERRMGIAA